MHKLLTLLMILGFTAACETTQDGYESREPSKSYSLTASEQREIDACAYGDSQACINLSVAAVKRGSYGLADELAEVACSQGSRKGCMLKQDLADFREERIQRRQQRQDQADRDVHLINLMNQSAGQMGTVTAPPAPARTRCITKWNPYLKQQETVCEQD